MAQIKDDDGRVIYQYNDEFIEAASVQELAKDMQDMGVYRCRLVMVIKEDKKIFQEVVLDASLDCLQNQLF